MFKIYVNFVRPTGFLLNRRYPVSNYTKTLRVYNPNCVTSNVKINSAFISLRNLHVTPQRNAIPPIVLLLLRPVAKLSAMLFGRTIRKWWARLPQKERERILAKIRSKNTQISFVFTVLASMVGLYYLEHIEEDPLTKRKRFMMYSDDQMQSIAQMEFESVLEEYKKQIVPVSSPIYNRVVNVGSKIISANKHLTQISSKDWAVTVVDMPEVTNAFVLPNGKIVVFTGILNIATNDDQLATVLAHEIAHVVLSHITENLSKTFIVEMILLVPLVLLWAMLPDAAALFSQWLSSQLASIMIHLPHSRATEKEADVIGLELAARACFDVREAPVFWAKMAQVGTEEEPEWLSTHPSNEARQTELAQLVPAALGIRESCQCARLPVRSAPMYYLRHPLPTAATL